MGDCECFNGVGSWKCFSGLDGLWCYYGQFELGNPGDWMVCCVSVYSVSRVFHWTVWIVWVFEGGMRCFR